MSAISIHISQVTLPEGSVSKIDDRDFTIATIVAPSALKKAEGAAAAAEVAADSNAAAEAEAEADAEEEAAGEE